MLLEKDKEILTTDINERSITHKLAGYLEPLFVGWDVDCEYNRNHDNPKRLKIPRRKIPNNDTQARTVFPDIIVHKRGTDKNLLVIELKKTTSQQRDDFDLNKLKAFRNELCYKFAVFIKIRTGNDPAIEKIDWIQNNGS
ncbi:hypothetical protein JXL19_11870 [bacterium]|nr:hypothetical protein [bacterium]